MAEFIGHIGKPHGPYQYSKVRCVRKGFLSIFTYWVSGFKHRLEMMDRGNAVVVLPVDLSTGAVTMIRQPRFNLAFLESFGVRMLQDRAKQRHGALGFLKGNKEPDHADVRAETVLTYELPAGMIDDGETPEQAALRELREETGLIVNAARLKKVAEYFPSIGGSTEHLTAYIADITGIKPNLKAAGDDQNESIDVWRFDYAETVAMLRNGRIRSASSHILLRELRHMMMERGYAD